MYLFGHILSNFEANRMPNGNVIKENMKPRNLGHAESLAPPSAWTPQFPVPLFIGVGTTWLVLTCGGHRLFRTTQQVRNILASIWSFLAKIDHFLKLKLAYIRHFWGDLIQIFSIMCKLVGLSNMPVRRSKIHRKAKTPPRGCGHSIFYFDLNLTLGSQNMQKHS